MTKTLSPETISIVKATAPALKKHGLEITERMYARMFAAHPDIETMFNKAAQASGEQPKKLAGAILAYAENIDMLKNLEAPVARMNARHVQTDVKPEHYPIVAENLLAAIKDVLGDAATQQILDAWGEAYWFLADIMIAKEQHLYAAS